MGFQKEKRLRRLDGHALRGRLVTYNGKTFDVPFIERFFKIQLPQARIDVLYPLRSLGLRGSLKDCEQQHGIARPGLEEVDGSVAVLLWNEFRRCNNHKALESLLAYNIRDALAPHSLMVYAHKEKEGDAVLEQPLPSFAFTSGTRV